MAASTKFSVFTKDLLEGKHQFGTHVFKVMLTNTAPNTSANTIKANITEIAAGNGYTAGGPTTTMTVANSGGVGKVTASDVTITASGAIGPFRYAVVYNDTQTTPAKPLVAVIDYGSAITLASGDTFSVDFDGTNGLLTITDGV